MLSHASGRLWIFWWNEWEEPWNTTVDIPSITGVVSGYAMTLNLPFHVTMRNGYPALASVVAIAPILNGTGVVEALAPPPAVGEN